MINFDAYEDGWGFGNKDGDGNGYGYEFQYRYRYVWENGYSSSIYKKDFQRFMDLE
jgi:hypothetical protein